MTRSETEFGVFQSNFSLEGRNLAAKIQKKKALYSKDLTSYFGFDKV
jgi:hypothetical protein